MKVRNNTKLMNGKKRDGDMLIADNFLLIAPSNEKILKMVIEGDSEVYDFDQSRRNDQQLEYMFAKKIGIGALIARNFAIYQIA